jgi:hypothetical protein
MPAQAALAPTVLDELRDAFRTAYRDYVEAGRECEAFLSELRGRTQSTDDLQKLLEFQTAESRAYSRYNEARMAYVSAVFTAIS